MGHTVRIIGADFSHLRKQNPSIQKDFEIQTIDGVEFQWIKTGTYEGNGLRRAITMLQFCSKLWMYAGRLAKAFKPDAVIASSTYPLDTFPARRIARLAKGRLVHEAHDLWPLTLTELSGLHPAHPFVKLLGFAEKQAYAKADAVVSILPSALPHMLCHGLDKEQKFVHIPNGVAVEDWVHGEPLGAEHQSVFHFLHAQGKQIVCYLGGHAISNALDTLLDAACEMQGEKDIAFVLVGNGTEKERLVEHAEHQKLRNVVFLPPVSKKQVPALLKEADMLYIGASPCSLYRYGVSMNKLYDYMMAEKPILNGVEAANNDVEAAQAGISFAAGNALALAEAIRTLARLPQAERQAMGRRGRDWVLANCTYDTLAKQFLSVLEKDSHFIAMSSTL